MKSRSTATTRRRRLAWWTARTYRWIIPEPGPISHVSSTLTACGTCTSVTDFSCRGDSLGDLSGDRRCLVNYVVPARAGIDHNVAACQQRPLASPAPSAFLGE